MVAILEIGGGGVVPGVQTNFRTRIVGGPLGASDFSHIYYGRLLRTLNAM